MAHQRLKTNLSSLWNIPSKWKTAPLQDFGTPRSRLSCLPTELILCIVDHLPTSSFACLALCSHYLNQTLGTKYWDSLRQKNVEEQAIFLSLLSQDLPRYFFCRQCSRLHLSDELGPPYPYFGPPHKRLSCLQAHEDLTTMHASHRCYSNYALRFPHVQQAMKRHRHGLDHGISLDTLSYTEVHVSKRQGEEGTTLLSVEARVASDELLLRTQQWILIPADKCNNFVSRTCFEDLCPRIRNIDHNTALSRLLECRLAHWGDQDDCSNCVRTFQCQYCPMEYQISLQDFGEKGAAMYLTKWLNLGAGLTDLDPVWQSHLPRSVQPLNKVPLGLPLGGVRSSFEAQEGVSLDRFAKNNATKLLEKHGWKHWKWKEYNTGLFTLAKTNPIPLRELARLLSIFLIGVFVLYTPLWIVAIVYGWDGILAMTCGARGMEADCMSNLA